MEQSLILEAFKSWLALKMEFFKSGGFDAEFIAPRSNCENAAMAISLFGEVFSARITVWESGNCESEVLCNETMQQEYYSSLRLEVGDDFDAKLSGWFDALASE